MTPPRHFRSARAEATLRVDAGSHTWLEDSPVLHTGRVAGVMAARRGTELLPYAHDAELTEIDVAFSWEADALHITTCVEGFARAGLGSRALLAAQVCATTIVDMLPRGREAASVDQARITEQRGGLDALAYNFDPPVRAAVLSTSDAVAGGHKEDRAGQIVRQAVEDLAPHGVALADYQVLADDSARIEETIAQLVADGVDVVFTVGGTGLAHTDVTVDTVEAMLDRPVPGIMEAARAHGQELTPLAFMSRGVAGLVGDTLVVTFPGSRGGARDTCDALFPAVLHVVRTLRKSRKVLG